DQDVAGRLAADVDADAVAGDQVALALAGAADGVGRGAVGDDDAVVAGVEGVAGAGGGGAVVGEVGVAGHDAGGAGVERPGAVGVAADAVAGQQVAGGAGAVDADVAAGVGGAVGGDDRVEEEVALRVEHQHADQAVAQGGGAGAVG